MKNYLSNLDSKILNIIRAIGREADRRQTPAYVVGGFVRDTILKRKNFDLDITVEGNAISLSKALAKKWKARLTVYKRFGTVCLELPRGIRVDCATARKERYKYSGALPVVQAGNLREDLFRRDFTINAMAIVVNSHSFGQLINKFRGLEDLSEKKIRVLHDKSFIDDPTRILRAVRFEQRFHFQVERKTLGLMKSALKKKIEENVKPPRYFSEFKKILNERNPLSSLKRLYPMGGLRFIDSKLAFSFQKLRHIHGRIQNIKNNQLYKEYPYWWLVYFIELIAKTDDRVAGNILGKFPFTKNERINIQQSRKADHILKKISEKPLLASQIYEILKPIPREVILYLRLKTSKALARRRIDQFLLNDSAINLQINGNDLKEMGIISGRKMGKILSHILCLKIDKHIHTKQEECNEALRFLGKN